MRKMQLTTVLAASLLMFSPAVPVFDLDAAGAAHAKGNGNGNGNGGGNGKSESKKSESKSAEKSKGNSDKSAKSAATKKPKPAAAEGAKAAKGKPAKNGELAPNELGKMNGAMNANINAVLAHIRNGQTTKGPVGLLAGLAVADTSAAAAADRAAELEARADSFDALQTKVEEAGFASVDEYLQAKADSTLTEEQLALSGDIDSLIGDVGGTDETGLQLAESRPSDDDIQAARDAAAAAAETVIAAEQAILDAWNKDGDAVALLTALRNKLAPHQAAIDAAVAQTSAPDETAAVEPEEESVIIVK